MWHDLHSLVQTCVACQPSKIRCYEHSQVEAIPALDDTCCHVHVDLVDRNSPLSDFMHLFTCTEQMTSLLEAIPLFHNYRSVCPCLF